MRREGAADGDAGAAAGRLSALFAGAATGVAAEAAGFSPIPEPDDEEAVEEPGVVLGPAVTVHDCPDGAPIAVLAGGDGVLATGRTEDGLWIEIRSPLDTTLPAWMSAGTLDPDGDLADLPVHECAVEATTTTTGSTTTVPGATTTTSTSTTEHDGAGRHDRRRRRRSHGRRRTDDDDRSASTRRPAAEDRHAGREPHARHDCTADRWPACPNPNPPGTPTTSLITVTVTDNRPGVSVTMTLPHAGAERHTGQRWRAAHSSAIGPATSFGQRSGRLTRTARDRRLARCDGEITVRAEDAAGNVDAASVRDSARRCDRCPP